ncbi:MAG: adenylate/guanylate cyclase domain-containing protein [Chitinophagaceae bacterium]
MPSSRQLAVILFSDIVGYTALMGEDEEKAFEILDKSRDIHKSRVEQYNGKWVKEMGDGVLASFSTVSDAVWAACSIKKACEQVPDLQLRIGIHLGEVIFDHDDVYGDGVNIASRLQALAPVDAIWVSESVHNNISNKRGIESYFVKEEKLKNVKDTVRIYEVRMIPIETSEPVLQLYEKESPKPVAEKSIAVLPFVNMSNDPEQEYFSDGMAEEILNSIAHLKELKVAGRTSSFQFKGTKVDLREVGEKLGVKTVLEGSVRKQGNRLRVTAQLVNVEDGFHIWSERYDRDMDNIFAIQDEIALSITERLKITLLKKEIAFINKKSTNNKQAYQLYLKGRFFCNKRGPGIQKGMQYFQQAIDVDPDFALAHAGIGDAYALLGFYEIMPPLLAMPKARKAAERAIWIDSLVVEAHSTLALVSTFFDWNWIEAKKHFKRAFLINPSYAPAHFWYSMFLSWVEGKCDDAVVEANKAVDFEPLVPTSHNVKAISLLCSHKFEEALQASQLAIDLDANSFLSYRNMGTSHLGLEQYPEAIEALETAAKLSNRHPWALADLSMVYASAGGEEKAQKIFDELIIRSEKEFISGMNLFIAGYFSKNYTRAFEFLEQAFEQRDSVLVISKVWPFFAVLRKDSRFQAFIQKMNFPSQ